VANRVVLAVGAYASPAILQRSGVGPATQLRSLGIEVVANLPGVGKTSSTIHWSRSTCRHLQVLVNGELLASTHRPALIIETGVPPRWYIPPGDVRWDRLTLSPHHTTCQYKGQACYWTVDGTDPPLPVWSYLEPLPEVASLAGLIGIPDDDPAVQLLIGGAHPHGLHA
jgi:uncharacterized protein (DUF427 family)